jgi:protein TonB
MNMYESSLFSGRKGAALTAVILLHIVFGFALYSELTARIGKKLDPPPLNLTRIETPKETINPLHVIPQTPPQPSASTKVRTDPKHPLRIGEDYYPDASRRANEEGRCVVRVTVAADGRIIGASIQTSSGFDRLDQACLKGVRGQHMLAATEDGKPIEQTILMPISWKLSDR